ncbi:MAG: MBL fold metallo-hydrolase, partial [Gemmatimonadaceae bacterium]|nr:MBL fold metallo-hydrolase [Gemmatimonadaceae bacterium]
DRPGGSSIAGWAKVLEGVLRDHHGDTIYIFGHAGTNFPATGTRADLEVQRDYLVALLDYVRGEMKAGKSRDVIVKVVEPLKGFPDHGPLTERVLGSAYDELAG